MVLVVVFGVALLIAVLLPGLAARTVLSTSFLFLVGGALVSDGFLGLIHITPDSEIVSVTADLGLFAVLFTDGMQVSFPKLRANWRDPARALGLGMPLAFAGMALMTHYLVGLDWTTSFLVDAVLAPTDPVFASAIVGRKEVPAKLRQLLNVESKINDGLALPVVLILIGVILYAACQLTHEPLPRRILRGRGAHRAVPGGQGVVRAARRGAGGAGEVRGAAGVRRAADTSAVRGPVLRRLRRRGPGHCADPPGFLLLSLIGTRFDRREKLVAAWFGPKGFASVVYGLLVLQAGIPQGEKAFTLIAVCIAFSIIAHSSTDVPIARTFDVEDLVGMPDNDEAPPPSRRPAVSAHELAERYPYMSTDDHVTDRVLLQAGLKLPALRVVDRDHWPRSRGASPGASDPAVGPNRSSSHGSCPSTRRKPSSTTATTAYGRSARRRRPA